MTAKTICFANQKGGVAKSVSTINTAEALALKGRRVLCVDTDSQRNTTVGLGIDLDDDAPSVYELVKGEAALADVVVSNGAVDVVPASFALSLADIEFQREIDRYLMLLDALAPAREAYDYILIDTPTQLGWATISSLAASDWVVIPCEPSSWSNRSMVDLNDTFVRLRKRTNPGLKVAGILVTKCDDRTVSAKRNLAVTGALGGNFGMDVFRTRIVKSTKVDDALNDSQSLIRAYPLSKPAICYKSFADELERKVA